MAPDWKKEKWEISILTFKNDKRACRNYHLQWDEHISIALIIAYIELKSAFRSLRVSIEREKAYEFLHFKTTTCSWSFNSELHSKCSKYKYKSIMMEAFQHLRLSERHFRITETKEIWQQLDCPQFERLKNCRLHITIQQ